MSPPVPVAGSFIRPSKQPDLLIVQNAKVIRRPKRLSPEAPCSRRSL
jgi:hypothetical protein